MSTAHTAAAPALEHKAFPAFEIKVVDKKAGVLEAIVSVFNIVDFGKDLILPGFFAKSLRQKFPKGVWMHDWTVPIAKCIHAEEFNPGDPRLPDSIRTLGGLYIKAQFNLDTQRGREAFSDIDFGNIDEFSIGYLTEKSDTDNKTGVRTLIEGKIIEFSPVLMGMNPATVMLGTKAGPKGQPPMPDAKEMSEGSDASGGALVPEGTEIKAGAHVAWKDRDPDVKAGCGVVQAIETKGTHGGHEASDKDPVARIAACKLDADTDTKCAQCKCMATKTMVHHPVKHLEVKAGMPDTMDEGEGDEGAMKAAVAQLNAEIARLNAELATKAAPAPTPAIETKGPYLGDTDESMTAAALDRLHSMLGWYLFACVHSDKPLADVLTAATGAIDEYKATCLKLFSALLEDEDGEDEITPEAAPPYGYGYSYGSMDHRVLATKYLARLASLDTSRDGAATTLSMEVLSRAVATAVGDLSEAGRKHLAIRTKEGRTLSSANRQRISSALDAIKSLSTDLEALLTETEPKAKEPILDDPATGKSVAVDSEAEALELRRRQFLFKSKMALLGVA